MNMQDKEMDNLFRSKLEGFEAEPSAGVWANISHGLSGASSRRKSLAPFLRIAASIAILVTAGLLFLPKAKVKMDQPGKKLAHTQYVTKAPSTQQTSVIVKINPVAQQQIAAIQSRHQLVTAHHPAKIQQTNAIIIKEQPVTDPDKTATIINDQQAPVIAKVAPQTPVSHAVVPDAVLNNKPADDTPEFIAKPAVVLASNTPAENDIAQMPAKKRRIHGLGGLINMVVASVDKRKDKIIEFTDTDEGDTVTGINLGFVKVKKEK